MAGDGERYVFLAEWFDKVASVLKKFYLYYYPSDNSVELYDLKIKKVFLRRSKCEGVSQKDFHIGATVTIFSRNMKITDFADAATKKKLSSRMIRLCALIIPSKVNRMGEIIDTIINNNCHISNIKMIQLTKEDTQELFCSEENLEYIQNLTKSPSVVLELLKSHDQSEEQDLKILFESYELLCQNDQERSNKDLNIFFNLKNNKKVNDITSDAEKWTCCIIKPHAVQAGLLGKIISDIQLNHFIISDIQQFYVDPINAEEFLEIYKGVLSDFPAMVSELESGPCIVMKITVNDSTVDVVDNFRNFCGPMDPEIARKLRPNTLRAKYGKSKIQNAVHCSDLPEDGLLEVEYFFKILNS